MSQEPTAFAAGQPVWVAGENQVGEVVEDHGFGRSGRRRADQGVAVRLESGETVEAAHGQLTPFVWRVATPESSG